MAQIDINDRYQLVEKFIHQTNQCIFLTGKAGSGKTTLLKKMIDATFKETVVVAPTGIAALNAGGSTIHSFFLLPFSPFIPEHRSDSNLKGHLLFENKSTLNRHFKHNKQRKQMFRSLELLVIDEVSMLRADLLDAMDWTLRCQRDQDEPFGGVQVLFIGDLYQLPPIVKPEEWQVLKEHYASPHFFSAKVLQEQPLVFVELDKIFRQSDPEFIQILNQFRTNTVEMRSLEKLNTCIVPDDAPLEEGTITLTTHNRKAADINNLALGRIENKPKTYQATVTGDFPEHIYPIDYTLVLKEGAQVMFVKNDPTPEKKFYNGKMAKVLELHATSIKVQFIEDQKIIEVDEYEWENKQFSLNASNEIEEKVLGTFVQYPIKLAWAITIHKSQGLTFDKAQLDMRDIFAPGQAYVALSRLRSLEGLSLKSGIRGNALQIDPQIVAFSNAYDQPQQLEKQFSYGQWHYVVTMCQRAFQFRDLIREMDMHAISYNNAPKKSIKSELHPWYISQFGQMTQLREPAEKFVRQLAVIGNDNDVDRLLDRIAAAKNYFLPAINQTHSNFMKKILEIQKAPKAKQLVDELLIIENLLVQTIQKIEKTIVTVNFSLSKELPEEFPKMFHIQDFRMGKMEEIKQIMSQQNDLFIENIQLDASIFSQKEKGKKEKIKTISTQEKTLELLQNGYTVQQIAKERQFAVQTIYNHIAKLITSGHVKITDHLSEDKLALLKERVKGNIDTELKDLKAQIEDEHITYDELKLYRATL